MNEIRFFRLKTIFLCAVLLTIASTSSLNAQTKAASEKTPAVRVPFIACRNFAGNGGSPEGELPDMIQKDIEVYISSKAAEKLAYYKSPILGVLAPRGWHCIGSSGTSGAHLYVTPHLIKQGEDFDGMGSAVIAGMEDGTTSGRFGVADEIGRYFPKHKKFRENVIKEGLQAENEFPTAPYPADKVTYLNDDMVEILTPAEADGFGTEGKNFHKNAYPISGVALIADDSPDVEGPFALLLHVRLEKDQDGLTSPIIRQYEEEESVR